MATRSPDILRTVTVALLGAPDAEHSTDTKLRFGRYSVDLERARVYDFDDETAISLETLVARQKGLSEAGAAEWLAARDAPRLNGNGHHREESEPVLAEELADEHALIGLIFLRPDVLKFAEEEVAAGDFISPLHAAIFRLFLDARENDYKADIRTVVGALTGEGYQAPAGFTVASYVARLAASAPFLGDDGADQVARALARSIRQLAEVERGAEPEPESTAPAPFVSKFGAVWFHEVGQTKPTRNWLFKNLLLGGVFGIAYGPPGCGKSFLISDAALHGAASKFVPGEGRPLWFGYRGRQFGTVYVVAEGRDDFEIRLHAWREAHNVPKDEFIPFAFLPTSVDMRSNDVDTNKLVQDIAGLSAEMERRSGVRCELVVIDTVARVLAGGNENASEVMSAFVRNCGRLQEQVGVTVLGVHHGGKEAGRGPRGHEALHGAADFEIEVIGGTKATTNEFVIRKLKAGPGGASHRFKLRQVKVGVDSDGDPVTSCSVVPVGEQEAQNKAIAAEGFALRKQEEPIFRALMEAIRKHGNAATPEQVAAGVPDDVMTVDYLAWRDMYKTLAEPNADGSALNDEAIRKRFRDYQPGLVRFGVIGWCRPWLWWTGKVIRGFPDTKPKEVPGSWSGSPEWSDEALNSAASVPDQTRTEDGPADDLSRIF